MRPTPPAVGQWILDSLYAIKLVLYQKDNLFNNKEEGLQKCCRIIKTFQLNMRLWLDN